MWLNFVHYTTKWKRYQGESLTVLYIVVNISPFRFQRFRMKRYFSQH